ncbi:KpsF/GutQ family sugar-phosphate isomerase [Sphingomonas sp. XMGL2]|uniref:KpsF/GutQ family sugar-phosphate isomerase n=2 Tax=Sphingomonas quercus TaxID=2842451 RepID=A0ABS6BFU5_9SPHN|nr:KpsF/GutQ family sugar-phosphate isomerase [Sphingomonas quercus]
MAQRIAGYGREVIETEAAALSLLIAGLDDNFVSAVDHILGARGRIVVSGMGKSGHIGRKFAATLASTGSPALFVHPAEASHGDLGMLVRGDLLIVLSNSGATIEVRPIMRHARGLGIPVIGIGAQENSPVMRDADIRLLLPQSREACPANIAPTTSTALMLALGDALAIAAMRERGVSRDGLQALHPGGNIGLRLKPVSTLMHPAPGLPLVSPTAPMAQVIVTITAASFGIAGVVNADGRLLGVITDGDLRRHADQLLNMTAEQVMTCHPVTVPANGYAEDALALMKARRITALFVTGGRTGEPDVPVGLVHIHDFLRLDLV